MKLSLLIHCQINRTVPKVSPYVLFLSNPSRKCQFCFESIILRCHCYPIIIDHFEQLPLWIALWTGASLLSIIWTSNVTSVWWLKKAIMKVKNLLLNDEMMFKWCIFRAFKIAESVVLISMRTLTVEIKVCLRVRSFPTGPWAFEPFQTPPACRTFPKSYKHDTACMKTIIQFCVSWAFQMNPSH